MSLYMRLSRNTASCDSPEPARGGKKRHFAKDASSGISSVDVLMPTERHPACRQREARGIRRCKDTLRLGLGSRLACAR
jgi:hypothetical protein